MRTAKTQCLTFLGALLPLLAKAEDSTNKWDYDLFHPTPTNLLRSFQTDRPSKTDVPFTVDAGHFQLETDFANYTGNQAGGVQKKVWAGASNFSLKAGLLNNVDFQLISMNYIHAEYLDRDSGRRLTLQGFGDVTARLKINLFGNESTLALAALPYVKLPTDTGGTGNHSYEGGVNLPFAASLPWGFNFNAETGAGVFRNGDDGGYHAAFNNSAILYHTVWGKLCGYAEYYASVSSRSRDSVVSSADFGLIYQLTPDIALDANTAVGLTTGTDNINAFFGIGVRF